MSGGIIITLIICSTIVLLSICGIAVVVYVIKKGIGIVEKGIEQKKEKK